MKFLRSISISTAVASLMFAAAVSGASDIEDALNPIPPPAIAQPVAQRDAPAQGGVPTQDPGASAILAADVPRGQVLEEQKAPPAKVFGEWLFMGKFAQQSFTGFNPEYLVTVGDRVNLQLWGAHDFQAELQVDAQGNIFVPKVGPIKVINIRNGDLNEVVRKQVERIYRENVGVYATLAAAQPVKVFVSGFVRRPGLYNGYASDSPLQFLDRAGGINPESGSFLDVRVVRGGGTSYKLNLYDFMLRGVMPLIQFRDGDTIIVEPLTRTVRVSGLVSNPYQVEFSGESMSLKALLEIVGAVPNATHARITRNSGLNRTVDYVALSDAESVSLFSGDEVDVVADKALKSIIVFVEGEHLGRAQYVLPYGATLGDLLAQMQQSPESNMADIQLFRKSVAERQKAMIDESLRVLESSVLAARSATKDIAELRIRESELLTKFIAEARKVVPKGQVVLTEDQKRNKVSLEDGDRIRVPRKSQLVAVHGEVYFPSSFLFQDSAGAERYIDMAGGYTQKANRARVLVLSPGGKIDIFRDGWGTITRRSLNPGDEILVLPGVDDKNFQFAKEVIQVIYQVALSTGVVLRL